MGNFFKRIIAWWRGLRVAPIEQTPAAPTEDTAETVGQMPYRYRETRTYTKGDEWLWRRLGHERFKRQRIARREQRQLLDG